MISADWQCVCVCVCVCDHIRVATVPVSLVSFTAISLFAGESNSSGDRASSDHTPDEVYGEVSLSMVCVEKWIEYVYI